MIIKFLIIGKTYTSAIVLLQFSNTILEISSPICVYLGHFIVHFTMFVIVEFRWKIRMVETVRMSTFLISHFTMKMIKFIHELVCFLENGMEMNA